MIVLSHRRAVIEWAGRQHAFPVRKKDAPDQVEILRPGDPEAGYQRIGWKQFFTPLDRARRLVAVDAPDAFGHRILTRAEAHAQLPPEAFGAPWSQRFLHEIWLGRPAG